MLRALIFAFSLTLAAQTPDTAAISGHIVDQSHAVVAGVKITVKNALTNLERAAQSDPSGNFRVAGLPIAGKYTVTATKLGFADASLSDLTLSGGATSEINLQLNVASGQTQVTVTGVGGEVRTDGPQLGDRLTASRSKRHRCSAAG